METLAHDAKYVYKGNKKDTYSSVSVAEQVITGAVFI